MHLILIGGRHDLPFEDRKVRNPASRDDEDAPAVGVVPDASWAAATVAVTAERTDVCGRFHAACAGSETSAAASSSRMASKCFPKTVCMRTCASAE